MKHSIKFTLICCMSVLPCLSCSKIKIDDIKWATQNAGATSSNPYGKLYTYEEARKVCPKGWRLPTKDEFKSLAANYSLLDNHNGMNGLWFSGTTPYKSGVKEVFLPMGGYNGYGQGHKFIDSIGEYWSSTLSGSGDAYTLRFDKDVAQTALFRKEDRASVRCVKD